MQPILSFAGSLASALLWLLPMFCYIGGATGFLSSLYGFWRRGFQERGGLAAPGVPEVTLFISAAFLSFPEFLNMGNKTLGFSSHASIGNGGGDQFYSFSEAQLSQALSQGPTEAFTAIMTTFHGYFLAYGAFIVFIALQKQLGRVKGTNRSSPAMNLTMGVAGLCMMNSDVLVPNIMAQLNITK